jgi:COMPASS component SWD1
MTRNVCTILDGHVRPIIQLCWSFDSQYLLTTGTDWNCIYWDLKTNQRLTTIRFNTLVLTCVIHPKRNDLIVASTYMGPVVSIRIDTNGKKYRQILYDQPPEYDLSKNFIKSLCFDRHGKYLFMGTFKGWLIIMEMETKQVLHTIKITNGSLSQICTSRRSNYLAINATDRTIHIFEMNSDMSIQLLYKLQDLIDRNQWRCCTLSSDEEYIIGGLAHKAEHKVYIWDRLSGNLIKILEGPNETIEDLSWHPFLPVLATVSSNGRVYIWSVHREEYWSAYAPEFSQIEENIEYVEREDEFDVVVDQQDTSSTSDTDDVQTEPIDVTTLMDPPPYDDSDVEENTVFSIPVQPDTQLDQLTYQVGIPHSMSIRTTIHKNSSQ